MEYFLKTYAKYIQSIEKTYKGYIIVYYSILDYLVQILSTKKSWNEIKSMNPSLIWYKIRQLVQESECKCLQHI